VTLPNGPSAPTCSSRRLMLALSTFSISSQAAAECLTFGIGGVSFEPCGSQYNSTQEWLLDACMTKSGCANSTKISSVSDSSCLSAKSDLHPMGRIISNKCKNSDAWVVDYAFTRFAITREKDQTQCMGVNQTSNDLVLEACAGDRDPKQSEQSFKISDGPAPIEGTSTISPGLSAKRIQRFPCSATNQQCGGTGFAQDQICCHAETKCVPKDNAGGKYYKQCCLNGKC